MKEGIHMNNRQTTPAKPKFKPLHRLLSLALCAVMLGSVGAVAALAADSELAWSQAPATVGAAAAQEQGAAVVAYDWADYAEFFSYPVWVMLQSTFAPFCLKEPGNADALYAQFASLQADWRGRITSESALSDYLKAIGDLVKPALTKDGQEIFDAYLPCYALARLVEQAGSDIYTLWAESDEMKALVEEMGIEMWQLDKIATYNADNIDMLKKYFSNWAIVTTRYLKGQGVEFPDILEQLVERSEYYDAVTLTLWGKEVIMKHWYDWVLLIVCFGWIWMAF